jgi:class 3 adenylate cyclase
MLGVASISEFQKRVDLFSKQDWQRAFDSNTLAELSAARYPLHNGLIGFPFSPVAMWGLEPQKSAIRLMSGDLRRFPSGLPSKRENRRAAIDFHAAFAPILLRNARLKPTLDQLCGIMRHSKAESEYPQIHYREILRDISATCVLQWVQIGEMYVSMLFEKSVVRAGLVDGEVLSAEVATVLRQIGGLIYDYNAFRLPYWRAAPAVQILGELRNTTRLRNIFADPLSFDPDRSHEVDSFYWPWQRCLTCARAEQRTARYTPIPTTSLVLDLRSSTTAMELTDPPEKFAELIDQIVATARETILKYRGFFDKDTGDGVSGHFCHRDHVPDLSMEENEGPIELQAIRAGQEIVQRVQSLCLQHQKFLRIGMDKFGAGIGIHSGTAVWLADEVLIRAIGSSVVGAARMCSNADAGELVISNATFRNAMQHGGTVDGLTFNKKSVTMKEYGDRIGAYAYSARVTG